MMERSTISIEMNPIERYKRILSTNFSEIHSHIPIEYLGDSLPPESQKHFKTLKSLGNIFITSKGPKDEVLLDIFDFINKLPDCCNSMDLLSEFVSYLRIQLLSTKPMAVHRTTEICDVMIKNCGTLAHILLGEKRFLYTLSKVSRWWLLQPSRKHSQLVAHFLLDCIQAWGEAFETRMGLYPHYYITYMNLRKKEYVEFLRPQYDPTRVPIFLGPITQHEQILVQLHQQREVSIATSDEVECKEDELINWEMNTVIKDFPVCPVIPPPPPPAYNNRTLKNQQNFKFNFKDDTNLLLDFPSNHFFCEPLQPPPPLPQFETVITAVSESMSDITNDSARRWSNDDNHMLNNGENDNNQLSTNPITSAFANFSHMVGNSGDQTTSFLKDYQANHLKVPAIDIHGSEIYSSRARMPPSSTQHNSFNDNSLYSLKPTVYTTKMNLKPNFLFIEADELKTKMLSLRQTKNRKNTYTENISHESFDCALPPQQQAAECSKGSRPSEKNPFTTQPFNDIHLPSVDTRNEYVMYGNQRVVIRK